MAKTCQKLSKKSGKLTDDIDACNSLTNFEYEVHPFLVPEIALKTSSNQIQQTRL